MNGLICTKGSKTNKKNLKGIKKCFQDNYSRDKIADREITLDSSTPYASMHIETYTVSLYNAQSLEWTPSALREHALLESMSSDSDSHYQTAKLLGFLSRGTEELSWLSPCTPAVCMAEMTCPKPMDANSLELNGLEYCNNCMQFLEQG